MRVQESKICVCESSKRQEIIASQNAMLRQARKPGASSGKLSWHISQLKVGDLHRKPAEMNLFKYAKVMSCITTATSILGMFRYLQYQLHKLMLCTLGVSKIMDSANHNISFKAVSQFFGIAYPSSFFLANGLPSDTRYDRDVT